MSRNNTITQLVLAKESLLISLQGTLIVNMS